MNKAIKDQWLKDLRSEEYPQSTGVLRNDEGFCCYGVLAEQAVKAGVLVREQRADGRYFYAAVTEPIDSQLGVLPYVAWRWAELDDQNPVLPNGDVLTELNDEHVPFTEIADLIEQYL